MNRSHLFNNCDRRIKGGWTYTQFHLDLRGGIGAQGLTNHTDAGQRRDQMQIGVRQYDHVRVTSDDGYYLPILSDHHAVTLDELSQELDAADRHRSVYR